MIEIDRHTIFLTLAGSHAHGTAREGSDVDLRGVCVAPLPVRLSLFESFEHYDGPLTEGLAALAQPRLAAHPTASKAAHARVECAVFDVGKLLRLCCEANPNVLEILFAHEQDWLFDTPAWRLLYDARHQFLTKKVKQTFLGYAMMQLKRIKTHRAWLLAPPAGKPIREDFGLPPHTGTLSPDDQNRIEQSIAQKLRSYGLDDVDLPKPARIALHDRLASFYRDALAATEPEPEPTVDSSLRPIAAHALHIPTEVLSVLDAERRYRAAMKHWEAFQRWQSERNPARAELERRHGYDTKHAMHLVRLMRMGIEALRTGDLQVRRPDAAELTAIRDGALSFPELEAAAVALREDIETAALESPLPHTVDPARVNALAMALMLPPPP